MNILFISPSNAIGGAEISLLQMVQFLKGKGHGIFLVMPPSTSSDFEHLLQPYVDKFLLVPLMAWNKLQTGGFSGKMKGWLYRMYKSQGGWFYAPILLAHFIRQHKIDLVHTNSILALDGALAAKIMGIPHIQHLREITGHRSDALFQMPGQGHPRLFNRFWGRLHHTVIANSLYCKNSYKNFLFGDKIKVLYNMVDAGVEPGTTVRGSNPMVLGMVANVTSKVKNHLLFLEIAGRLNRQQSTFHYGIFGKMPKENDPYLQGLEQKVIKLGLQGKLTFKGLVEDSARLYGQMNILLHPYPYESFGRVFIEAMAHGIPVVAARGGGADELIIDGQNGFLFDVDDPETAVHCVQALSEDPGLYARMVQNGLEFAQKFRSENIGAALLTIYHEALA